MAKPDTSGYITGGMGVHSATSRVAMSICHVGEDDGPRLRYCRVGIGDLNARQKTKLRPVLSASGVQNFARFSPDGSALYLELEDRGLRDVVSWGGRSQLLRVPLNGGQTTSLFTISDGAVGVGAVAETTAGSEAVLIWASSPDELRAASARAALVMVVQGQSVSPPIWLPGYYLRKPTLPIPGAGFVTPALNRDRRKVNLAIHFDGRVEETPTLVAAIERIAGCPAASCPPSLRDVLFLAQRSDARTPAGEFAADPDKFLSLERTVLNLRNRVLNRDGAGFVGSIAYEPGGLVLFSPAMKMTEPVFMFLEGARGPEGLPITEYARVFRVDGSEILPPKSEMMPEKRR